MMIKMSTINERVLLLIENQSNDNKRKFAKSIGYSAQVISNIVSGRKSNPSFEVLFAITKTFVDVNPEWLLTGKGEMLKVPVKAAEEPITSTEKRELDYKVLYEEAKYTIELQKKYIENLELELKNKGT